MNTPTINKSNVDRVREEIQKKMSGEPYHYTSSNENQVITDHDTFPYTRYWRGVPSSSCPTVFEREAGWRVINNDCYKPDMPQVHEDKPYPSHCFQNAYTTIQPCFTPYNKYYNNKKFVNKINNDNCVVSYR